VKPLRRAAKEREFLIQVNVDAPEENRHTGALVLFIECQGEIKRNQQALMAHFSKRRRQGIITKTIPAVHAAGAGRDQNDVHARAKGSGEVTRRQSRSGPRPQCHRFS
jgi:hypothetical protein